jgi:hypothetical protein
MSRSGRYWTSDESLQETSLQETAAVVVVELTVLTSTIIDVFCVIVRLAVGAVAGAGR